MAQIFSPSDQAILARFSLPPRPKVLIAINEEVKKENASFAVIASLIAEDVSIASAALKIVNSPAFRRPKPIGSIDQALTVLGLKRVLAIVNAVSIRKAMKSTENLEEFWEFGATVASAGILVAQQCKKAALADDAYTTGLFHDACGPFLMTQYPSYYSFFRAGNAEGWLTSMAEEKEKYSTTHTILGALMAQDWCLPDHIVRTIYNLHNAAEILSLRDDRDPAVILLAITKCAREMARIHQFNKTDNPEWLHVRPLVLEYLNLDDADYVDMRDEILDRLNGV